MLRLTIVTKFGKIPCRDFHTGGVKWLSMD
nr:MAG TPA: DNA-directed RNA polymerase subunit beta' [Caudoviricetes sp.]